MSDEARSSKLIAKQINEAQKSIEFAKRLCQSITLMILLMNEKWQKFRRTSAKTSQNVHVGKQGKGTKTVDTRTETIIFSGRQPKILGMNTAGELADIRNALLHF